MTFPFFDICGIIHNGVNTYTDTIDFENTLATNKKKFIKNNRKILILLKI